MSAALDFDTLDRIRRGRGAGIIRAPCPVCSPQRQRNHQRKPCLSTWAKDADFITFACGHCKVRGFVRREGTASVDQGANVTLKPKPDDYAQAQREKAMQREKARWLWRLSQPAAGSIVETYLRSREITCAIPATIRFLPATKPQYHPAMIAAYALASEPEPGKLAVDANAIAAIHLTKLKADGSDKINRDDEPAKITIGSPAGMPLVLAPMNDLLGLAVVEGIEDGLSIFESTGLGVWAAGSAPFMPRLVAAIETLAKSEYDASPDCITIFAHPDKDGLRDANALATAMAKLSAALSPGAQHFKILQMLLVEEVT